ncbi:hypothetical protein [Bradyrhizobium elkanii]|uniref:hypothetical protein n=1 Tax=Bradyrhizobium elkanii TaxID=29448 RepID=UPI000427DECC|nr:hypothetical protein [Bradyrhizobium elkanii]
MTTGMLTETTAKRIATLFRMLSSEYPGEILGAVAAMKRLFANEGLSFHEIANVIESCNGEIEERKYSDADAEIIFQRGVEKGRSEQQPPPLDYYEEDGSPRWHEIALFCRNNTAKLKGDWEQEFITDMVSRTLVKTLTPRQQKFLFAIFVRLGGPYDAARPLNFG